jgi:hypothetical protein
MDVVSKIIGFVFFGIFASLPLFASEAPTLEKLSELQTLQSQVITHCIQNNDAKNYSALVNQKILQCPELILVTKKLTEQVARDMDPIEACDPKVSAPHQDLTHAVAAVVNKTGSCKPSADGQQCLQKFACSMVSAAVPMLTAMAFHSENARAKKLAQCAKDGLNGVGSCMLNFARGVFDALWNSVTFIADLAKLSYEGAKSLFHVFKQTEKKTSEKALAAQQTPPSLIKQLVTHPIVTVEKMAANFYQSLETAALEHYGCEKWKGLPFRSECIAPMSTWKCGTCQQKFQVFCGIGGYAMGEIPSSILSGALLKAGGMAFKGLASGPSRKIASYIGNTFPKSTEHVLEATKTLQTMARNSLTVSQAAVLNRWRKMESSSSNGLIYRASQNLAKGVSVTVIHPISVYIKATNDAYALGGRLAEKAIVKTETKLVGKATDQVVSLKTDETFGSLFSAKKVYEEEHDDIILAITTLQKSRPELSKAEIKSLIESRLNSCSL